MLVVWSFGALSPSRPHFGGRSKWGGGLAQARGASSELPLRLIQESCGDLKTESGLSIAMAAARSW